MDEDDRFIPLAFAGAFTTALASAIALVAGDLFATVTFALTSALSAVSFAGRTDATGGAR